MKTDINQEILKEIENFDLPAFNEIPNIGLFLEQTQKYVAEYTDVLGSVVLTSSMISNYVKKKILANPVKKQYNREQIGYLFFISIAKTVLSLEDVQLLISLQNDHFYGKEAYEFFRAELKKTLIHTIDDSKSVEIDENISEERKLLKNTIITIAHKIYLDKYFAKMRERMAKSE